jgi:hypothetical protein
MSKSSKNLKTYFDVTANSKSLGTYTYIYIYVNIDMQTYHLSVSFLNSHMILIKLHISIQPHTQNTASVIC